MIRARTMSPAVRKYLVLFVFDVASGVLRKSLVERLR